jgi:hypothetical protein
MGVLLLAIESIHYEDVKNYWAKLFFGFRTILYESSSEGC